jgi:hypothetical protein
LEQTVAEARPMAFSDGLATLQSRINSVVSTVHIVWLMAELRESESHLKLALASCDIMPVGAMLWNLHKAFRDCQPLTVQFDRLFVSMSSQVNVEN